MFSENNVLCFFLTGICRHIIQKQRALNIRLKCFHSKFFRKNIFIFFLSFKMNYIKNFIPASIYAGKNTF